MLNVEDNFKRFGQNLTNKNFFTQVLYRKNHGDGLW
jgi:hypothetical protein